MTPQLEIQGMLPSPCVGICRLDDATGWCLGCARDANELGCWRDLSPAAQALIWADLPRRKAILGLSFRLLPWSGAVLLAEFIRLAREPKTGWSIGVYGAVAEFASSNHATPTIEVGEGRLVLRTPGGAMRLHPPAGTRMFELVGATGKVERRVLALHRSRLSGIPAVGVTELGADEDAIEPTRKADRLFDLGVSRHVVHFCVRTGEPALVAALRGANGLDPLDPANGLVPALLASSPDRVLISPIGRIEVYAPILRLGREGPHTHLLPNLLALGHELEPGFALPEGYAAGVSIFPLASQEACTLSSK
jgi:predicted Fe-S protein YdhL (DUF1289 family)